MSNKSPIFPMTNELHHDHGFHPQFHYFQMLEEARKHRRENPSMDALHLKLQNPNSKDHHHHLDSSANNKKEKKIKIIKKIHTRKRWWKNPLLFFSGIWSSAHKTNIRPNSHQDHVHPIRRALSRPLYITESRTPYRTTSRRYSGQLMKKREMDIIPYVSLRDLNMDHHHRLSPMPMPIYLVT